jgi:hypothetical protein
MAFFVLREQTRGDEFLDPEMDDAFRPDPEQGDHFGIGGHPPVCPEEGGEGFLNRLRCTLFFHGSPV